MGRRNSTDSLPREARHLLERTLTENSFTGYAEPKSLLKEKGYNIARFSSQQLDYKVEQQLARMRTVTEAARLPAQEAGDSPGDHSTELVTLVQTRVTGVLTCLQESRKNDDPFARAKLLATASKSIATLTHASVNLKRYQAEVRERVERAATTTERIARKDGLSAEVAQTLRREVLEVVS